MVEGVDEDVHPCPGCAAEDHGRKGGAAGDAEESHEAGKEVSQGGGEVDGDTEGCANEAADQEGVPVPVSVRVPAGGAEHFDIDEDVGEKENRQIEPAAEEQAQ